VRTANRRLYLAILDEISHIIARYICTRVGEVPLLSAKLRTEKMRAVYD
jgi:hypothetical protein